MLIIINVCLRQLCRVNYEMLRWWVDCRGFHFSLQQQQHLPTVLRWSVSQSLVLTLVATPSSQLLTSVVSTIGHIRRLLHSGKVAWYAHCLGLFIIGQGSLIDPQIHLWFKMLISQHLRRISVISHLIFRHTRIRRHRRRRRGIRGQILAYYNNKRVTFIFDHIVLWRYSTMMHNTW